MNLRMNVYDFDKTIYDGDSTVDFYFYCLRKHPSIMRYLPAQGWAALRFLLGKMNKTDFKQRFYRFLNGIADIDREVMLFWDSHIDRVKPWYRKDRQSDDVVISASPEFLLDPACKKLGIPSLMASRVDKHTGKYTGLNCYGEEKVRRYREVFGDKEISCFYSDSLSDTPLAEIAQKSFIVKGLKILPWSHLD